MKWITIVLFFSACAFSCEDTDQSEEESWTLQTQNSTEYNVKLQFFSSDAALSTSFDIPSEATVKMFDGLSGPLNFDPITARQYDSAFMIFEQTDTLKIYKDQTAKSILDRNDYQITKEEDDYTVYTYMITEEEYQMAE